MSGASITVTGHDQKAAWRDKVLPAVEQVRKGVWSIPVPFPNHPMRYTLSYLLLGADDAVLVDPGWASDVGWQHLAAGLAQADVGFSELTGVVVTHRHADHLGLAARVREASGAWVALGEHETLGVPTDGDDAARIAEDRSLLRLWGVPENRLDEVVVDPKRLTARGLAEPDLRFAGDTLVPAAGLRLRVVATPGHTPGHICLVDEARGLIFSGDHVLPRITPNISFEISGPVNPLEDYYESLNLIGFEDDMEVCPAHEYRFSGMRRRVDQLQADNRARSAEVVKILAGGSAHSIWEIARLLTWSRGWHSLQGPVLRLALGETASHVVYLASQGHDVQVPVREAMPAGDAAW
ncbi:MBL fold metallo-hydrolase [Arthrobacter sp. ISL-72]|uniref:MBL fold metallo-hydrolase n=1 Tax=Arthrobacter sp. ISL-72 TaxID=2819114 RepID=UPI001BE9AE0D|nr:MBL fold metallo-hydrolase [Arthrobacter sp. ISL-72]MBT2597864.1 MBL fold metallo-hydrolase [Arthrobacter sp. ISL-72]